MLNEYSFNIALKKDEAFLLIVSMYVDMYVLKHVMQLQIIISSVFIGRQWPLQQIHWKIGKTWDVIHSNYGYGGFVSMYFSGILKAYEEVTSIPIGKAVVLYL